VRWPSVNPPIFWNKYKTHFARYQKVCRGFHVKFYPLDYAKTQENKQAWYQLRDDPEMLAIETVEYNPHHDSCLLTARAAGALFRAQMER